MTKVVLMGVCVSIVPMQFGPITRILCLEAALDQRFFASPALCATLAETAADDDDMIDTSFAALIDYAYHGRCRHDDHGQVHGIGYVCDSSVARTAEDLAGPGVNGVDRSLISVLNQVSNDAIAQLMWITGSADDGYATGIKKWI